jgi:hypothetical protein
MTPTSLIVGLEGSHSTLHGQHKATFEPSTFFRYFPMSYQLALGNLDLHV